jgi:hypothetical protein
MAVALLSERPSEPLTPTLAPGSDTDNDPEQGRGIVTVLISFLRKRLLGSPVFTGPLYIVRRELPPNKALKNPKAFLRAA